MKSWQFVGTKQPLVLTEVPEPKAEPGYVVIDVKAAGLCHSDVGAMEDPQWLAIIEPLPRTIGHEVAGVIVEVGEGVTDFAVGDRVGVCPTANEEVVGYSYDGGFGPKVHAPAVTLVPIPDGVSFLLGAAGTDAGMTSHHAVIATGGVKAGTKVGIIGLGGLGQIGARIAVLAGAEVYAAEINEKAWEMADEIGIKEVAKDITAFADKGLEVIVDLAGFGTTTAAAIETVGYEGVVVQVGMGKLEATISTNSMILKRLTLKGSQGGTKDDIAAVYGYFASGDLVPAINEITFEQIPEGLERLEAGGVVGRIVANYEVSPE